MSITVRYPGRACLLGEHCDWAGGASLAVPLPLWIAVEVEAAPRGLSIKSTMDGDLLEGRWPLPAPPPGERFPAPARPSHGQGGPLRFVPAAAWLLADRGIRVHPAQLWVTATLPTGRGFSSSAAFSLAILDGLARHSGTVLSAADLAELAYVLEHDLLGVDCGRLDPLSCVAGAPVFLRWNQGHAPIRRIEPRGGFHLVVVAFPTPRHTRAILSTLNRLHDAPLSDPDPDGAIQGVHEAISTWSAAAERGARALVRGDPRQLGLAMNLAQKTYEDNLHSRLPALRAPLLRQTCAALRDRGALGAKFSGAGGDGSAVALFPDQRSAREAIDWLRDDGLAAWYVPLGAT